MFGWLKSSERKAYEKAATVIQEMMEHNGYLTGAEADRLFSAFAAVSKFEQIRGVPEGEAIGVSHVSLEQVNKAYQHRLKTGGKQMHAEDLMNIAENHTRLSSDISELASKEKLAAKGGPTRPLKSAKVEDLMKLHDQGYHLDSLTAEHFQKKPRAMEKMEEAQGRAESKAIEPESKEWRNKVSNEHHVRNTAPQAEKAASKLEQGGNSAAKVLEERAGQAVAFVEKVAEKAIEAAPRAIR